LLVLGIETSCDETSAALLDNGRIISNVIFSQVKTHRLYGGVVPEIAAREHLNKLPLVVDECLKKAKKQFDDIDAIAVTYGPGLAGGLIVGLSYAKALAFVLKKKFIGINHLEAHLLSPFLESDEIKFPYLGLVVSGGHTNVYLAGEFGKYTLIGETRDDAAGEAFDKAAKMLGLTYPGGPAIAKAAEKGDAKKITFPQAQMKDKSHDFSFSGIKTSVLYYIERNKARLANGEITVEDIAAAFQKSITRAIANKMRRIYGDYKIQSIAITGGVAANSYLKNEIEKFAAAKGIKVFVPSMKLCTDNAAMIAYAGWERLKRGIVSEMDLEAEPDLKILETA
jgi:N6-L-threonylcarbamoyladenine synthase